ncbi:MAG: hypothetical protein KDI38_04145 [Calditrichaeota bacterium]|nr:hypothetical protein [Calditrichota bacterium]
MKPLKINPVVTLLCLLSVLVLLAGQMLAQTRTHNLGDYKFRVEMEETINTNDVEPTGEWPQDHFRYSTVVFHNSGFAVFKWIDESGTEHAKEDFLWPVSYYQEAPYGIREVRRSEPPEVWVTANGRRQLSSRRFNGTVDPNLPADQMIEVRYKAYPGFDVLKRTYSYTNPNHDDYVLVTYRYLCTFDWDEDGEPDTDDTQTMEDVYFIFGYSFQTAEGTWITYSRWYEEGKDDWASYEAKPSALVPGGRPVHMSYAWDGDHPEIVEFEAGGGEFDDTGDPRFATGSGGSDAMPSAEFVSSAYSGFAALHVDAAPGNTSDWLTQPFSVNANMSIYNVWDSDFPGFTTIWDWAASGSKQTVENQSGWPDDAGAQEDEYCFQAFGPYDFRKGDSIMIAYAVGANGISRDLAIEKGLEWRDWYRGGASTFDDAAKNELLATGKDSIFQTLDRALWTWNRNLDIPDPLPAPDLEVTSGPNRIELAWEDLSATGDWDSGTPDLDYYRIYRKRGNFLVDTYTELNPDGTHLRWELLAEVPASQTSYIDNDVVRGEAYHYAVTAVDDGSQNTNGIRPGQPLESSKYANRTEVAAFAFAPGAETAQKVRIVPNPYVRKAGDFNFTGDDNKILFVNLPPYCTLNIFTVTGDLVKTIDHSSGSADESWDQVTNANQFVASGVYILQVDEAFDLEKKPMKGSIEKFVIIR